jgi:putative transposase
MLRHAAAKGPHVLQEFVGSLHRVVANWLVRTFVAVYVPALGGEEQSRRCRLRLGAHVAQDMDMWGHTEFLRLLQATAADSSVKKPCVVHVVDEAYTTRTCTLCGVVASYMGGATVFSCAACGLQLPRDWNGARGIWLRSFAR